MYGTGVNWYLSFTQLITDTGKLGYHTAVMYVHVMGLCWCCGDVYVMGLNESCGDVYVMELS
jgi:hypothetical protein